MTQGQPIPSTYLGKKAVRFVTAVVALLILRAVLGILPMLAGASAISGSLMSPLVIADAVADTLIIVVLLRFGFSIGRTVAENSGTRFPDIAKIVPLTAVVIALLVAYRQYETPTACLVFSPSDLSKAGQTEQMPINIDQVLPGLAQLLRGVAKTETDTASGATLTTFQKVAVMILRQPPDIYGWTFLVLISLPAVGIAVLVSRNLDAFTEAVFQPASSSAARRSPASVGSAPSTSMGQCGSCGQPMEARSKFCPNCGAPSSSPTIISSARKVCSSCGADNPAAARFCKECGQAA